MENRVYATGVVETFTLLVLAGPHEITRTVNAYSRSEDGDLTLYAATIEPEAPGRPRYDGLAFFPKGGWHGILKVEGNPREVEAPPRKMGFQPPE
jgi:hypothetical protein